MQNLNPKEKWEILKQALMTKIKAVLISFGGWVVLGCLIIGVILLCFAALLQVFEAIAGFFGAVWDGIQYVFIGTKADVNSDDIAGVRDEIKEMGVDFDEIGYLGAIKEMGGVDNYDEYASKIDGIASTMVSKMNEADSKQKAVREALDKRDELEKSTTATSSEIEDAKKKVEDAEGDLSKFEDKYIEFYVEKYLQTQAQTGAAVNGLTFSDDKGAIRVKVTSQLKGHASLWEKFKNFFTGSYSIKYEGGKFTTRIARTDIDITKNVHEVYMPWKYPFAFHNETLSPDIGYLVAVLGETHNYMEIIADIEEILVIEAEEDDEGEITSVSAFWIDDKEYKVGDEAPIEREVVPVVAKASTWYSTDKYGYVYDGECSDVLKYNWNMSDPTQSKFDGASKNALLGSFKVDDGSIYYTGGEGNQEISSIGFEYYTSKDSTSYYYKRFAGNTEGMSEFEQNASGQSDMRRMLLPVPEFDDNGELTNESELPRYYIANRGEQDDSGNYTGARSILNVKTNAEAIVQAINDIYKQDNVSPEEMGR